MFVVTDWEEYKYRHTTNSNTTPKPNKSNWPPNFYVSMKGAFGKCWSVDIPYIFGKTINTFSIRFRGDVFLKGIRPQLNEFGVVVHYPHQLWTADFGTYEWKSQEANRYTMKFKIENIIVHKRRNKRTKPCNENWKNDDDTITTKIINTVGCNPPAAMRRVQTLPNCTTKEQMKDIYVMSVDARTISRHLPPCQQIEKVIFTYEEFNCLTHKWINDEINKTEKLFEILFEFLDGAYMEVKQTKHYDGQSLIGNAGGYIGLFLGYGYSNSLPIYIYLYI